MISRKWIAALARLRGGGAPASRTPGAEAQSRDRWDPPARGARLRGGGERGIPVLDRASRIRGGVREE